MSVIINAGGSFGAFGPTTRLTANKQYYISNAGSDTNPGTLAQPWATIQHAFDVINFLDLNGFVVYVNLAAGSYAGGVAHNLYSSNAGANANTAQGGYVQFVGDNVTPSNVTITNGPLVGGTCFFGLGAVYGQFQGVFITGVRLSCNNGPCISADPALFAGVGNAFARFVLGTNDGLFNGLIEIANCGNHQPIFSGNVTDNPPNGGIFTVNILANLFTGNPKCIFEPLSQVDLQEVQADYFILNATLTCTEGLFFIQDSETRFSCFPSIFRNGAGGGYSGRQYHINSFTTTTGFSAFSALTNFSIGTAGLLSGGFVRDSNSTAVVQFQGTSGWPPQTTQTGNYAQVIGDRALVFNGGASITLTLLPPGTWPGLELLVKTIANQTVVSASANVISLDGSSTGTAILAATAGKWALLKSNGTNWEIMAAN